MDDIADPCEAQSALAPLVASHGLMTTDHTRMRKSREWMLDLPQGLAAPAARFVWRDERIDAPIDSYVAWREECETVDAAYERWGESERSDRALAHASYRAALDREAKAAGVYRMAATRLMGAARERR